MLSTYSKTQVEDEKTALNKIDAPEPIFDSSVFNEKHNGEQGMDENDSSDSFELIDEGRVVSLHGRDEIEGDIHDVQVCMTLLCCIYPVFREISLFAFLIFFHKSINLHDLLDYLVYKRNFYDEVQVF